MGCPASYPIYLVKQHQPSERRRPRRRCTGLWQICKDLSLERRLVVLCDCTTKSRHGCCWLARCPLFWYATASALSKVSFFTGAPLPDHQAMTRPSTDVDWRRSGMVELASCLKISVREASRSCWFFVIFTQRIKSKKELLSPRVFSMSMLRVSS